MSFKILINSNHELLHAINEERAKGHEDADLIFFDTEAIKECDQKFIHQIAHKVVLISESPSIENIRDHLHHCKIRHILGRNGPFLEQEILRTIDRFKTKRFWGIEQYLAPGDYKMSKTLSSSTEISGAIDEVLSAIDLSKFFDSPSNFIKTVSDELLTNAIYNAPLDENGVPKYRTRSRKESVTLLSGEEVHFSVGQTYNNLFISVQDNFGALTIDKLMGNLSRGAIEKSPEYREGGAGLGLYLVYSCCNEVVFNCAPGKRSEVIAIFEGTKRYKSFRSRITSFHYFEGDVS